MNHRRHLLTAGLLALLLVALAAQPAFGQGRGEGRITQSYRADKGTPPGWAQAARDRALGYLATRGRNAADFAALGVDADDLGMQHVRLQQHYAGLPVFGSQQIVQLDAAGNLLGVHGSFADNITVATKPAISAARAIAIARRELNYKGQFVAPPAATLLILPNDDSSYTLAYQVSLKIEDGTDATAHHQYFINAADGSVAWYYNSLPNEQIARPRTTDATGTGNSLYSGAVSIHTDLVGSTYNLRDTTRGGMYTTDMNNGTSTGNGTIFTDADNTWGTGTTSSRQSAGVDAHFGAAQTWDYYLNTHSRRGIDNNGFTVISRVHYGSNYNNAFWNSSVMTYGDGDGTTFRPLVSLDVAGHEITHGVTEKTANLVYANESGALNESFSDIFGTAVEFYTGNVGGRTPDYFIGEDIQVAADAAPGFRNMADPQEDGDPDNYATRLYAKRCRANNNNDQCGVHSNSGIQNNAFYLLAQGGTNRTSGLSVTGIGRAAAEKIFYRALTVKLTSSATFSSARAACLSAAVDLYGAGSAQYNATAQAWTAVGVN